MKRSLSCDQVAFLDALVQQYGDMLTKYAYRMLGYQPHMLPVAQDAVQEVFLRATMQAEALMRHPNPAGWLKVCLRNVLLNLFRTRQWRQESLQASLTDEQQALLNAMDRAEDRMQLQEVIRIAAMILTDDEHATFQDHFLDGLTTEESALLEGVSSDTVRGRISRIRKKLKKHFGMLCGLIFILLYR